MTDDLERELLYERRGRAAWITFNRPHARNAMTFGMYDELERRCEEIDADDGLRVAILRGAGGRAFVAGTDISQFRAFTAADGLRYEQRMDRVIGRLERVRKPTIALVEGHAVGGGLALAAACDLRVCTPGASFGLPIARTLGNCLSMEGYARLAALVGVARAKHMIFTALPVAAEAALQIGLVSEIVTPEAIEEHVEQLGELVAGHAPITLRVTKEALLRLRSAALPDGSDLITEAYGSADFARAVDAFADKRTVEWRGT
jgi:enoyl-CoA hydratase/carnithine racemase